MSHSVASQWQASDLSVSDTHPHVGVRALEMLTKSVYHIHAMPVPPSGDCVATGPHVDPYVRGEVPPCDNTQPQTCQVGDLAGKHGNITTDPFSARSVPCPDPE